MNRRTFLGCGLALGAASPLRAALTSKRFDDAAAILEAATARKQVAAAALHVTIKGDSSSRGFGAARNADAMFLLGSISKPIAVTALMTLFDKGEFRLADHVQRFLPSFAGDGRDRVTIRHLLTHTSGLPDQLSENDTLRRKHAQLPEFVDHALKTPLQFPPGSRYQYSSMGILLAARIAESISGMEIKEFITQSVLRPLGMSHSAQGLGSFPIEDFVPCQMEGAAPESGGGDPSSKDWNWNSPFWRSLGAPWGGTHASAPDVGRFLDEFLSRRGQVVKPETAALMVPNRNPKGVAPRGLGFNVGIAPEATAARTARSDTQDPPEPWPGPTRPPKRSASSSPPSPPAPPSLIPENSPATPSPPAPEQ